MSNLDFSVSLELLSQQFNSAIKEAKQGYSSFTETVNIGSEKISASSTSAESMIKRLLNVRSDSSIKTEINQIEKALNELKQQSGVSESELTRATTASIAKIKDLSKELNYVQTVAADAEKYLYSLLNIRKDSEIKKEIKEIEDAMQTLASVSTSTSEEMARAYAQSEAKLRDLRTELNAIETAANQAEAEMFQLLNTRSDSQIKAEIAQIEAAMIKLESSSKTSANELAKASDSSQIKLAQLRAELDYVSVTSEKTTKEIFGLLNIRSEGVILDEMRQINQAFNDLQNSANVTGTDISRAYIEVESRLKSLSMEMSSLTGNTREGEQELRKLMNFRSDSEIKAEIRKIEAALNDMASSSDYSFGELERAAKSAEGSLGSLRNELNNVDASLNRTGDKASGAGSKFASMKGPILGAAAAYVGLNEAIEGLKSIVETSKRFDSLNQKLQFSEGSAESAKAKYEELVEVSNRLGLEQLDLAKNYAGLSAAGKEINLTSEEINRTFTGTANAVAGMSLTTAEANSVFLSLSQIASKGKVSMEELRQQLGERLTPALGIAAKSMGISSSELDKLVSSGNLASRDFLPAFGDALTEAFGSQAQKNVETMTGKFNLLSNQFTDLKLKLGEGLVGDGVVSGLDGVSAIINKVSEGVDSIDPNDIEAIKSAFKALGSIIDTSFNNALDLITYVNSMLGSLFGLINSGSREAEESISGISVVLGVLSDGIKGIDLAFTLLSAAVKLAVGGMVNSLSKLTFGDLRQELEATSDALFESARQGFEKAKTSALEFESSSIKALQGVRTQGDESLTDLASIAEENYNKMAADAKASSFEITQAAIKSVEAQIALNDGVVDAAILAGAAQKGLAILISETGEVAINTVDVINESFNGVDVSQANLRFSELATKLKIDLDGALKGLSKTFKDNEVALLELANSYDDLGKSGYDASIVINSALQSMLNKAANTTEIEKLIDYWKKLGDEGKLSAKQISEGMDLANDKIKEMAGGVDELTRAYEKFNLVSKQQVIEQTAELKKSFDIISKDVNATKEQLQEAFLQYAESAILANDGVASSTLKTQAAMYKLQVSTDDAGNHVVAKMSEAKAATQDIVPAAQNVQVAYAAVGQSSQQAAIIAVNSSNIVVNALQTELKLLKEKDALLSAQRGAKVTSAGSLGSSGIGIAAYSLEDIKKKLIEGGYTGSVGAKAQDLFQGFINEQKGKAVYTPGFAMSNFAYINDRVNTLLNTSRGKVGGQLASDEPVKRIEVDFKVGQEKVNLQLPENQEDAFNRLLEQLGNSRNLSGK